MGEEDETVQSSNPKTTSVEERTEHINDKRSEESKISDNKKIKVETNVTREVDNSSAEEFEPTSDPKTEAGNLSATEPTTVEDGPDSAPELASQERTELTPKLTTKKMKDFTKKITTEEAPVSTPSHNSEQGSGSGPITEVLPETTRGPPPQEGPSEIQPDNQTNICYRECLRSRPPPHQAAQTCPDQNIDTKSVEYIKKEEFKEENFMRRKNLGRMMVESGRRGTQRNCAILWFYNMESRSCLPYANQEMRNAIASEVYDSAVEADTNNSWHSQADCEQRCADCDLCEQFHDKC